MAGVRDVNNCPYYTDRLPPPLDSRKERVCIIRLPHVRVITQSLRVLTVSLIVIFYISYHSEITDRRLKI